MNIGLEFFLTNILLGVGLAMDAFSVSLANGLSDPQMKTGKMCGVAGTFAFFQALMPLIGWICVSTIAQYFTAFETLIPWIALGLLGFIGGKMLYESVKSPNQESSHAGRLSFGTLIVQGVATSIDALSVGFTIAHYRLIEALLAALVISLVTFVICLSGIFIGKKMGTRLAGKAGILGGVILILIGLWIFVKSWF